MKSEAHKLEPKERKRREGDEGVRREREEGGGERYRERGLRVVQVSAPPGTRMLQQAVRTGLDN